MPHIDIRICRKWNIERALLIYGRLQRKQESIFWLFEQEENKYYQFHGRAGRISMSL